MPYGTDEHTGAEGIGARIREVRALRGYSLAELSTRAHVSTAMLSYVERGERYPSEAIVASVARALGVGVSVLRGQPYITQMQRDRLDRLLNPISSALDEWGVAPLDDNPLPRPLDALESGVMQTRQMRATTQYITLAEQLPGLLVEIAHAAQLHTMPGRERERAHWLMAEAARSAFIVAYKVGHMDLARLALSRMAVAAAASGDPRQVAIEHWLRAQLTFEGSRLDLGLRLVDQALRALEDDGERTTRAVRGALHLKGAILAARKGDGDASEAWLDEAHGLAQKTGETRDYELVFGPVNVELHRMAAASDRDEHGLALARAQGVRLPEDYPPARAGHYWIDRARAEVWTAQHEDALESLQRARAVAPQQTRYHPQVRETVAALVRARQRAADPLREFAAWSGV